jgi:hypothetical protein
MGLAQVANADPWDREREVSGRGRMAELRERINGRDSAGIGRGMAERTITGREIGRNTIEMGDYKRDFKDRNDMAGAMTQQTKMRATATAQATADEGLTGDTFPNAGRALSKPAETMAKAEAGAQEENRSRAESAPLTSFGKQAMTQSITGKPLGQDTITRDGYKRDFKDRNDMMSQLNQATRMRAERTAAARGDDTDGSRSFPNVGHSTVSDPSKLSPEAREALCRAGACIGKRAASADVEDKTK